MMGFRQPNYPPPKLPAHLRKTYRIKSPITTHTRPATCGEVDCDRQANGWITRLDLTTTEGQFHAETIRNLRGYSYTITARPDGLTDYTFAPGQECFEQHRVPLDRPALFGVFGGDWRGNPRRLKRVHANADDWLDDFATHQDKINTAIQQG